MTKQSEALVWLGHQLFRWHDFELHGRRRLVISICLFTVHICYPWLSCGSIAKPCGVMVCVSSGFDNIDSIVANSIDSIVV